MEVRYAQKWEWSKRSIKPSKKKTFSIWTKFWWFWSGKKMLMGSTDAYWVLALRTLASGCFASLNPNRVYIFWCVHFQGVLLDFGTLYFHVFQNQHPDWPVKTTTLMHIFLLDPDVKNPTQSGWIRDCQVVFSGCSHTSSSRQKQPIPPLQKIINIKRRTTAFFSRTHATSQTASDTLQSIIKDMSFHQDAALQQR